MNIAAAKYIELEAGVRYWEDCTLNGEDDDEGKIPLRTGEYWCPTIELETGLVLDWPAGNVADIHYKVCDDGQYWLLDEAKNRIAKKRGYYVPDDILCVNDNGYGDYIIMEIGADGLIVGWEKPELDEGEWKLEE